MPVISFDDTDGLVTVTCVSETPFGSFPCTNERMTLSKFEDWLHAMLQECKSRRAE